VHLIDWVIMVLPLAVCCGIAVYSRRYIRSVADFMAGGRNAGRFLLCTARSEQGSGVVVYVAVFQMFFVSGFTLGWWGLLSVPVGLLVAISGFVIYRYRQTRAMTLAQFFEMRYTRKFRLFTGALAFFAGLINFGIIPVTGARFMVYFLELPQKVHHFSMNVPTHLILMAVFLTLCTVMTTVGGQISVLLSDCAQGMISQLFFVFISLVVIVFFFSWSDTSQMLLATEPGKSLVNPFDSFSLKDFNIWYVLMGIGVGIYSTMAWQNSHAFNSSSATPHESRMGSILGGWRTFAQGVMITLLAVCAMTYLKSPAGATVVQASLAQIGDSSVADQMRIPVALSHLLPMVVKGMLLAICLMGIISGDGIHLHSWSSIFVQDVVMPLCKNPLSVKQHLLLLRCGVIGVAVFAFLFGALFPQTEYIALWFTVTQAIFTGGAGAAIIGGLYWSRGTSAGAWTGMLVGSLLSVGGIGVRLYYQKMLGQEFLLNGMQISFYATLAALLSYVVVSLLTCKKPHNMDRLLHRGDYAVEPEAAGEAVHEAPHKVRWLYRIIGIDAHFNRMDRWITVGIFVWSMFWFLLFVVGTAVYFVHPWSNKLWAGYWLVTGIFLPMVVGVVTTVWFTIGCWQDMRLFFRRLREETVDARDDGSVPHDEMARGKVN